MDYLAPDFDPSRLTKPQLRSILAENGFSAELPPPSAKKEVLVDLFMDLVWRNREAIRRTREKVKPSAQGIVALDLNSRPSPTKSPTEKTSSPAKKSPVRRTSSKSPAKRRRSPSRVEPTVKQRKGRRGSVTQSVSRSRTPVKNMTTPLTLLQKQLPAYADSPRTVTMKLHNRLGFISTANRMTHALDAMDQRRREVSGAFKNAMVKLFGMLVPMLASLLVLSLFSALAWYLKLRLWTPLPYCGSKAASIEFPWKAPGQLTTWYRSLCVECPSRAQCIKGNAPICPDGHVPVHTHWGLGLGWRCELDRAKLQMLARMVDQVVGEAGKRKGLMECGLSNKASIEQAELRQLVRRLSPHQATADFDRLFGQVLNALSKGAGDLGLKLTLDANGRLVQLEAMQGVLPLGCRVRRKLLGIAWYLGGLMVTVIFFLAGWWWWRGRQEEARQVEELVQAVLQILAEQDAMNRRDPMLTATISIPQLRDALFLKASTAEKNRLWPRVCTQISRNANVRESVMMIRGESHRVWEWIGIDVLTPVKLQRRSVVESPNLQSSSDFE